VSNILKLIEMYQNWKEHTGIIGKWGFWTSRNKQDFFFWFG